MWKRNKYVIILGAVLVVIYLSLFGCSTSGYGYMGHGGFHHGPSFWYMSGSKGYYPSRSRSVRGTGVRGGGISGGK